MENHTTVNIWLNEKSSPVLTSTFNSGGVRYHVIDFARSSVIASDVAILEGIRDAATKLIEEEKTRMAIPGIEVTAVEVTEDLDAKVAVEAAPAPAPWSEQTSWF